jgi:hypothetical protein
MIAMAAVLGAPVNATPGKISDAAPEKSNIAAVAPSGSARSLAQGIKYKTFKRPGPSPMVAHIVEFDLSAAGVRFRVSPGDPSLGMEYVARRTSEYLFESGGILAINASYFLPFAGGSPGGDDYYPHEGEPVSASGAVRAQGRTVSPVETDLDIRINAAICFSDTLVEIVDGQECPEAFSDGVAAGPRILAKGEERGYFKHDNRYATTAQPRTAIGLSADRKRAWIIVIDGRQEGRSDGGTLSDLAIMFRDLGASDAINLDGGGSSVLAVRLEDGAVGLLNCPVHVGIACRERPVANHISVQFLETKR